MAQHDYSIANQGFPATRADINNVLSAISTNNSGTSAPSTQFAGQFWIDTTASTWTLYIHDGADDIQFATIDTSANTVNFIDSALASDVVINTSGAITTTGAFTSLGIDDNATSTAITIDSSENILLNTTSAKGDDAVTFAPVLTVNGGSFDGLIEVAGNRSDAADAGVARLQFIQNSNSATYKEVAEIRVETEGATANQRGGRINFITRANGSTSTTERMRIDSSGNVGIGTTAPESTLHVKGTNRLFSSIRLQSTDGNGVSLLSGRLNATEDTFTLGLAYSSASLVIGNRVKPSGSSESDATGFLSSSDNSTAKNAIKMSTNGDIQFYNAGSSSIAVDSVVAMTERMRIHSNGVVSASAGIALGVGTANTASNVLDDYEEGTWTPNVVPASGTVTLSGAHGSYTKIGRVVYLTAFGVVSSVSSPSGQLNLQSIPFTPQNENPNASAHAMSYYNWNTGTYFLNGETATAGNQIVIYNNNNGTRGDAGSLIKAGSQFHLSGFYYVS
jgi:hypothetical protein